MGTYEDVTLVWTGNERYKNAGGCHNRLPKGVEDPTTDLGVWLVLPRALGSDG